MNPATKHEGVRWVRLGILFGLLGAASMVLFGPIGVSGTYPRLTGEVLSRVAPSWAARSPYLEKVGGLVRPETMIALGLVVGGFLASRFGRRKSTVGEARLKAAPSRLGYAFVGGFLLLFGARLAGGCTSGHVISGISQLSISGLVFGAGVFASGIVTAKLLKTGV